ncbi:MAG TPA: indole-3-glycerol phosphate synthase TrpC [Cytophagales bacterium]|nr:indole-3-glycerol phosphate synthase TrpC [Cytophagales bacterium]
MNILEEIVIHKRKEVELGKLAKPISLLQKTDFFDRKTFSIKHFLKKPDSCGIIAEFKRKSPSKGIINDKAKVDHVTSLYAEAGVSALSILTDNQFFGGSNNDLTKGREMNSIPVLRKDFIIDEYQIFEAKAIGADVILLIAAILTPEQVKNFATLAHSLGLEVLLEVHDRNELELTLTPEVDLVGVNNRNLKDFSVSINTSLDLAHFIPDDFIKISESGISDPNLILTLKQAGFRGFLIGENFMQNPDPGSSCKAFVEELRRIEKKSVKVTK